MTTVVSSSPSKKAVAIIGVSLRGAFVVHMTYRNLHSLFSYRTFIGNSFYVPGKEIESSSGDE